LAPFFEDWSQIKKLSEIKPPLERFNAALPQKHLSYILPEGSLSCRSSGYSSRRNICRHVANSTLQQLQNNWINSIVQFEADLHQKWQNLGMFDAKFLPICSSGRCHIHASFEMFDQLQQSIL
jgi:hypothetical protein